MNFDPIVGFGVLKQVELRSCDVSSCVLFVLRFCFYAAGESSAVSAGSHMIRSEEETHMTPPRQESLDD